MSRYAICLVTDDKYMLPTMVAACQARTACSGGDVDVFVFAVGMDKATEQNYQSIADTNGVKLVLADRGMFGSDETNSFIDRFFSKTSLTFGALGRLFLDQLLPPEYDEILYIDGDVQMHGTLDELVRATVPAGRMLAGPDPKVFWIQDDTPLAASERAYMAGLGFSPTEYGEYFNSGILRASRATWQEIGISAWEFLRDNPALCVNHDQSALNAVCRGRRLPLSIKWNYPAYYNFYGLANAVRPRITHFMSRPKPWNGVFPPWGRAQLQPYLDFVRTYPEVATGLDSFDLKKTVRYALQQRLKWANENLHFRRRWSISKQVREYEAKALP